MNEEPKNIWKKSWKGPRAFLFWLLIVSIAAFFAAVAIAAIMFASTPTPLFSWHGGFKDFVRWMLEVMAVFIVAAAAAFVLYGIIRWLLCWRNFKRFLFGLACLATLIALFYAEENWRGKHDWENYKHEWEAKGEKFDFTDFVPPPVPDGQNFALTPIVFTSYGQMLTRDGKAIPPDRRDTNFVNRLKMEIAHEYENSPKAGDWRMAKTSDLKAWRDYYHALAATTNEFPVALQSQSPAADVLLALSKYDSVIEELREAGKLPYSRFPLEYDKDDPAAILLPHLAVLKQCSLALQLRALAELQNGQTEKSFDDVKLALRLADSIRTEPFIITHLVRMAILQITLQPIWEGLAEHKWSEAQLAELNLELSKLDFPADYAHSVRSERAYHGKIVDWIEQKRSRYWELADMIDQNNQPNTLKNFFGVAAFYLGPKGWFYQNEITIAQMEQQWNLPLVDATNQIISPKMLEQTGTALAASLRPTLFNFFARLLLPGLGNFAKKTAYAQNATDLARVAIALERYRLARGGYPESLEALTPQFLEKIPHDIINGGPLHYRRTGDGQYILYSVGWNENDDGGVVAFKNGSEAEINTDTGDWVWRYPQK